MFDVWHQRSLTTQHSPLIQSWHPHCYQSNSFNISCTSVNNTDAQGRQWPESGSVPNQIQCFTAVLFSIGLLRLIIFDGMHGVDVGFLCAELNFSAMFYKQPIDASTWFLCCLKTYVCTSHTSHTQSATHSCGLLLCPGSCCECSACTPVWSPISDYTSIRLSHATLCVEIIYLSERWK